MVGTLGVRLKRTNHEHENQSPKPNWKRCLNQKMRLGEVEDGGLVVVVTVADSSFCFKLESINESMNFNKFKSFNDQPVNPKNQ